jgi:uncharacterized protein (DUF2236 family)
VLTTYGPTAEAERCIEQVRRVHTRVTGVAPDGRRYEANDPSLLTWVHTAEVDSFLRAHVRYGPNVLTRPDQDRYFGEVAVVAERLGAEGVPRSRAEVAAYYTAIRPELASGAQAQETIDFLLARGRGRSPEARAYRLICDAAIGLLPSWARAELGLRNAPVVELAVVRPAAMALFSIVRWALGPSPVVAAARQRAGAAQRARRPSSLARVTS